MAVSQDEAVVVSDPYTAVVYLNALQSRINLLQSFFELYEGVGTVRTIDAKRGYVCVITTPGHLPDCLGVLEAIKAVAPWDFAEPVDNPLGNVAPPLR